MKFNAKNLPLVTAMLGFVTLLLRTALYLLGTDCKGLLQPWHILNILCWAVTAASVLMIILSLRKLGGSSQYCHNFCVSASAAIGCFALAGGIAAAVITGWNGGTRLEVIRNISGLLAVFSLVWAGFCRWQGKQPFFAFHGITCLYLTLYMVSHYQLWCSLPQTQDYFFSMAGSVFLTLFSYYQTAFDVNMGRRRMQLLTGFLAGFFCITAALGTRDLLLYVGGAVWALTGLCRLTPVLDDSDPKEYRHESA